MSPIYVPGKVVLRQEYIGTDDPDAAAYIAAVEAADEAASPGIGAIETGVKVAIHSFVKGCKADGIWPAIKASCILAGARTLDGSLVPLVGAAPTKNGTEGGWSYNRETGLAGNGTNNYLNSNRNNNADPQDSQHLAVYGTSDASTTAMQFIGAGGSSPGRSVLFRTTTSSVASSRNSVNSGPLSGSGFGTGLIALSRDSGSGYSVRMNGNDYSITQASQSPTTDNIFVFCRNNGSGAAEYFTDNRFAFYSIGEALDLALLDARVTDLVNAIGAAIP